MRIRIGRDWAEDSPAECTLEMGEAGDVFNFDDCADDCSGWIATTMAA
jgi:hypothetical protein